ncbi:CD48 antigen-like, partial [Heterodontus francisci]|uniref:CD48 antigen-like n=1 Tax=Heterodontus francisci TaxID=7792 RepID=UPI00355B248D
MRCFNCFLTSRLFPVSNSSPAFRSHHSGRQEESSLDTVPIKHSPGQMDFRAVQDFPLGHIYMLFCLSFLGLRQCEGEAIPDSPVNGTLGESVMLKLREQIKAPEEVDWIMNLNAEKHKIICELRSGRQMCNPELRDRFTLHPITHALEIKSLRASDQGLYKITARSQRKTQYEETFQLQLYEAISLSHVTMTNVSINGSCRVTLRCAVENGSAVTYTWRSAGNDLVKEGSGHYLLDDGKTLEVDLPSSSTTNYTCSVRNPVSYQTQTIELNKPCSGNREDTDSERESKEKGPDMKMIYILAGSATVCLLSVAILFSVLRFQQFRKKQIHSAEFVEQSATVYAVIGSRKPNSR